MFIVYTYFIIIDYYMTFSISALVSFRDSYQTEEFLLMSDMDGVMMSGTIQKCHGMVYLSHISNTGKSNWKIYEREREKMLI
jgi:hypothetical protein